MTVATTARQKLHFAVMRVNIFITSVYWSLVTDLEVGESCAKPKKSLCRIGTICDKDNTCSRYYYIIIIL